MVPGLRLEMTLAVASAISGKIFGQISESGIFQHRCSAHGLFAATNTYVHIHKSFIEKVTERINLTIRENIDDVTKVTKIVLHCHHLS